MTEKETKKRVRQEDGEQWQELVMMYATTVIREFGNGFVGRIQASVDSAISNTIRRFTVLGISLLGVVLVVIGMVHLINTLTQTSYIGYFVLGGGLLLISFLVSVLSAKLR